MVRLLFSEFCLTYEGQSSSFPGKKLWLWSFEEMTSTKIIYIFSPFQVYCLVSFRKILGAMLKMKNKESLKSNQDLVISVLKNKTIYIKQPD